MRIDVDLTADAAYITLAGGDVARTVAVSERLLVDEDDAGQPVGAEVIGLDRLPFGGQAGASSCQTGVAYSGDDDWGAAVRHGRDKYEHIQDGRGVIGEDEPVFLLRAKDLTAPEVIERWAELAEQHGAPVRAAAARAWAQEFRAWQADERSFTRYPADTAC